MLPTWSEISILLNIPSEEILHLTKCKSSGWSDFFILLLSGGAMTGILQIISDAVGNKRVKEMNKMYQERILQLEEDCEYCFKRKEMYKDGIEIIRAKVEMFNRQNAPGCECLLSAEVLKTINQVLPDDKTITPGLDG